MLSRLPDPNVIVFNAMIAGFCRDEAAVGKEVNREALSLYSELQSRQMQPSSEALNSYHHINP